MSWDTWIQVGGQLIGGWLGNKGNKDAAEASNKGTQAGIDEQRRQFDLTRQDQMPWLDAGRDNLAQLQRLNSGDMSAFTQSPDYQFAYDQGMQALDRSAASRGNLFSGGQQADLMQFGQGLATQNYNNYYNRLAELAGIGQTAATNLGSFGQNTANSLAGLYQNMGNNRATSYANNANIWGNTLNGIAGSVGDWYGSRQAQSQPSYQAPSNQFAGGFGNNTGWLNGGGWD